MCTVMIWVFPQRISKCKGVLATLRTSPPSTVPIQTIKTTPPWTFKGRVIGMNNSNSSSNSNSNSSQTTCKISRITWTKLWAVTKAKWTITSSRKVSTRVRLCRHSTKIIQDRIHSVLSSQMTLLYSKKDCKSFKMRWLYWTQKRKS